NQPQSPTHQLSEIDFFETKFLRALRSNKKTKQQTNKKGETLRQVQHREGQKSLPGMVETRRREEVVVFGSGEPTPGDSVGLSGETCAPSRDCPVHLRLL